MRTINELMKLRREKLDKLEELGQQPYGYSFDRTDLAADISKRYTDEKEGEETAIAGRLMAIRKMGKASFAHLQDKSGRIQIYVKKNQIGEESYAAFKLLDIGDIIGIKGRVFKTRTGEITVMVDDLTILSKNLRPLPIVKEKSDGDDTEVFDEFADKEMRYRQRYVDLIVNRDVKEVFLTRSRIISSIRSYLGAKEYVEVETPVLQPIYGGALARPFSTHHNTLDMELFLRIADELYLKRLIVGGFEGVYEIAKDFRNEGMDKDHNPEFTMLELYVAYKDYNFMMELTEEMISTACREVHGTTTCTFQGREIDFAPPWKRISYYEAIESACGVDLSSADENEIRDAAGTMNIDLSGIKGRGKLLDTIFSEKVEPGLQHPTFVKDFPLELSPLAKKHRSKAGVTERFEVFVAGMELCNSFSELNDPIDQRERFEEQARQRAGGDEEAMVVDEDYLRAMEYGMPPTGGLGVGIDRLVMLLTDSASIRDVILFPQMRPEKG